MKSERVCKKLLWLIDGVYCKYSYVASHIEGQQFKPHVCQANAVVVGSLNKALALGL